MPTKMNVSKAIIVLLTGLSMLSLTSFSQKTVANGNDRSDGPRIVNIVNFIRLLEPRDTAITADVLYQTVVQQVNMMKQYHLGGTFLLQYDALMDQRYQTLLKKLPKDSFEIGAWWELPQPLIEKAGLKWRGRYPWDWHADVGFTTGYTPAEREKIADVYMADFKNIFGYYPSSVASWFIDAHTLQYLYEKYHIAASANCKDQYGTDGYTLWGGYWNQAYYPSRLNSYMPAQHTANQIPVPVFRMLGSDPVRQYDQGINSQRQGVITLEPVYPEAGGNAAWVNWFFHTFTEDPALGFNYTQAGQENSFTWQAMAKGFAIQLPLIAKLRDEGKIRLETLERSGQWFKKTYQLTPPTSFAVTRDIEDANGKKTIWYNSRFYRMNMIWENGNLRIRDIHLFNENFPDRYTTQVATSNECKFFTLPLVDGYLWSKPGQLAGLRLKALVNGQEVMVKGKDPVFTHAGPETMHVSWPLEQGGSLEMDISEKTVSVQLTGNSWQNWYFDLDVAAGAQVPFTGISTRQVKCRFEDFNYRLQATTGVFVHPSNGAVLRLKPEKNKLSLNFADLK